jgi:hypothetical protein
VLVCLLAISHAFPIRRCRFQGSCIVRVPRIQHVIIAMRYFAISRRSLAKIVDRGGLRPGVAECLARGEEAFRAKLTGNKILACRRLSPRDLCRVAFWLRFHGTLVSTKNPSGRDLRLRNVRCSELLGRSPSLAIVSLFHVSVQGHFVSSCPRLLRFSKTCSV